MTNKIILSLLLVIIAVLALSHISLLDYYRCDFTPITTVENGDEPYEIFSIISDAEGYINMKDALAGEEEVVFRSRERTGGTYKYRTNMLVSSMTMRCYLKGKGIRNAIEYFLRDNPRDDTRN